MKRYEEFLSIFIGISSVLFGNCGCPDTCPCIERECCPNACWTGMYVGFNGGAGWSKVNTLVIPLGVDVIEDFAEVGNQKLNKKMVGALFGGQAGFNWQIKELFWASRGILRIVALMVLKGSIFLQCKRPFCKEPIVHQSMQISIGWPQFVGASGPPGAKGSSTLQAELLGKGPNADFFFTHPGTPGDAVNVSIGNTNINSVRLGLNYILGLSVTVSN